jgi:hypothetical protein
VNAGLLTSRVFLIRVDQRLSAATLTNFSPET